MRGIYALIICILILGSCSNNHHSNATSIEGSDIEKFDSFLTQFALFDETHLNNSFFRVRKQFSGEHNSPEINKYYFSFLLPYDDNCNCVTKDLYYQPCYKIEKNNFYIISMNTCCDITKAVGYPYTDNTLVTYNKKGQIIDFTSVGTSSDIQTYKIEPSTDENEITYTQYYFSDVESAYDGDCNICVYNVTIDNNGKIEKSLLREEKNVKVKLSSF
jgi:hypothetical protein